MTPVGRFAPSPSGPLHAGSLLAALASYVDTKARSGRWLLRIDDIDATRARPDAITAIRNALDAHGLISDRDTLFQSTRLSHYAEALDQLWAHGLVYSCDCSRATLRQRSLDLGHGRYNAHCADRQLPRCAEHANRLRVPTREVFWREGKITKRENVAETTGDFVLKRRDGVFAYQLAIVVDDALDAVTDVVRGQDLQDNTARQVYLQQCLGLPTPRYRHVPLLYGQDGRKLSKSNGALPIDPTTPLQNLERAWAALGQSPAPAACDTPTAFLIWAVQHWQPDAATVFLPDTF